MTAVGQRAAGGISIGSVLDLLRPDFPDITISKIRFLESEGLISPQRSPSGYRRFSVADCERLRFVLTAQRDQYLPLKVIKEQLDAMDKGALPGPGGGGVSGANAHRAARRLAVVPGAVSPDEFVVHPEFRLTRADLLVRAGIEEDFLAELIRAGLVSPGPGGYFDAAAVTPAVAAKAICELGLEVRHLRGFKLAADREAALVTQLAHPIAKSREPGARDRAGELARELSALAVTLHTSLVKVAVADALQ